MKTPQHTSGEIDQAMSSPLIRIFPSFCIICFAYLPAGCNEPQSPFADTFQGQDTVLIFPGVVNTKGHLKGVRTLIRETHPKFVTHAYVWGTPLLSLHNLHDQEGNRERAATLGREIAEYRRTYPEAVIDLIGYSGGGGFAAFVVEALPDGLTINRLLLIAPALSLDYPFREKVLPHISEFVTLYASSWDTQLRFGTAIAGNMDGSNRGCIGVTGFGFEHPRVIELHWDSSMIGDLHLGNHTSYLSSAWQRKFLLPAIDPDTHIDALRQQYERKRKRGRPETRSQRSQGKCQL